MEKHGRRILKELTALLLATNSGLGHLPAGPLGLHKCLQGAAQNVLRLCRRRHISVTQRSPTSVDPQIRPGRSLQYLSAMALKSRPLFHFPLTFPFSSCDLKFRGNLKGRYLSSHFLSNTIVVQE